MLSRCVVSQVKHNSYFLVGLCLGLWVSLAVIPMEEEPGACTVAAGASGGAGAAAGALGAVGGTPEEFEPHHEEKPLSAGGQAAGRSVQRPRYYSTELGMRGSLLTGVLSSEEALKNQVPALNRTAARLQPALKFFITASAMSSVPGLANVVGFTDTREMLKPFHALKYLADNYLEEYDFFFLVSDTAFINARRLTELVSKLSVSQDVYMGVVAEDDSHYCTLDGGILLSNSVLRAIHGALDWCVRNSYSPHHHENIGRCVLHAAHLSCASSLQAQRYTAARATDGAVPLGAALADAVTVHALDSPQRFYQLHAYVSRVHLERDAAAVRRLRAFAWRNSARHPPHYRNSTWPGGLRDDPGLARPLPDNRFDHLRWTPFNASHAFMPDDHRNVAPITGAYKDALDLVMRHVRAWALRRWPAALDVQLAEGAWRWEPAVALRYRLLLRLTARDGGGVTLRAADVTRALGAARLVPVRYVTESARVTLLVPLPRTAAAAADALQFLQRYDAVCLAQDKNTALLVVVVQGADNATAAVDPTKEVRDAIKALAARYPAAQLDVLEADADADGVTAGEVQAHASAAALSLALTRVSRDTLLLLAVPHMEFNQDFLNRVRMNTISGEQWYLPVPFSRYSQYDHPRFLTPTGQKPQVNTGRFNYQHHDVLAFYRSDYDSAMAQWTGASDASAAEKLARAALRCVRAPEPGLVLQPRRAPCVRPATPAGPPVGPPAPPAGECARVLRAERFLTLDLGARHSLAQLLLEEQAERDG
ncbi:hypothetical protein O3G_MSEX008411 [Manduca sexta]|uniref:Hexosyltransferase n=1 Tax=Manduca sexta TaxID=7130 RepID=A0A921Z9Q3_MANSE|nr:hypothetical protein O3G_MSEX008411 [Manduca sexta]